MASAFTLAIIIFSAALAFSLLGSSKQQATDRQLQRIEAVQRQLQAVHYYDSDVSGWQSYVLLDSYTMGSKKALAADAPNYPGLLESKTGLDAAMAAVDLSALTAAQRDQFAGIGQLWEKYWAANDTLIALIRKDTALARVQAGTQLNTGISADLWGQLIDASAALSASVTNGANAAHAQSAVTTDRNRLITVLAAVVAALVGLTLSVLTARSITNPLHRCLDALLALSAQDLTPTHLDLDRRDELGKIANAIETTRAAFGQQVLQIRTVAEALTKQSSDLTHAGDDAQQAAARVAEATESAAGEAAAVSATVTTMAGASSAMHTSIGAVASHAKESAEVTVEAVTTAGRADADIAGLAVASSEISEVLRLVTSVADQTKLLALNATIEAARAGAAGKGFAVVAAEVGELARQTSQATEDIGGRVARLTQGSAAASEALASIAAVIQRIHGLQGTISSVVQDQTDSMDAFAAGVDHAAANSDEIARSLTAIAAAAADAASATRAAHSTGAVLSSEADRLLELISGFRT